MNNYTEIVIDGVEYPIVFGNIALEEFNRLGLEMGENNIPNPGSITGVALAIAAGIHNGAISKRGKKPDFERIVDTVDEMMGGEGQKKIVEILQIFSESRFGKQLPEQTENFKKKTESLQSQQTGPQSEDLPTEG